MNAFLAALFLSVAGVCPDVGQVFLPVREMRGDVNVNPGCQTISLKGEI